MKKLITVIMASLLLYSGYVLGTCAAADEVYTTKTVTVYSGDTMWDIASRWTEDGEDVRAVIYRICEANGLASTDARGYLPHLRSQRAGKHRFAAGAENYRAGARIA